MKMQIFMMEQLIHESGNTISTSCPQYNFSVLNYDARHFIFIVANGLDEIHATG